MHTNQGSGLAPPQVYTMPFTPMMPPQQQQPPYYYPYNIPPPTPPTTQPPTPINYFPAPPSFSPTGVSFIPQQQPLPPVIPPSIYSPPPSIQMPSPFFQSSGVMIPPPQPPAPIPLIFPSAPQPQQPRREKKGDWVVSYIPNEGDYEEATKDIEKTSDGWMVTDSGNGQKSAKQSSSKKHCRWETHGYCRSYNLKFHPQVCKDKHRFCRAQGVQLTQPPLRAIAATSAEYFHATSFLKDWQGGGKLPTVKGLYRIDVPHLDLLYDQRKQFIESLNGSATEMTLYHGTRESVLMDIYCNGFAMPADFASGSKCKKSGMLPGSVASLCPAECKRCSNTPHTWNKCHMFGLGVYFALQSNKSDIYVTDMNGNKPTTGRKMLICQVVLGNAKPVKQLSRVDEMHDMVLPPSGYHSIHAIGMGVNATIPTGPGGQLAVKLDEFIIFHPHQAVPRYLLEYDL